MCKIIIRLILFSLLLMVGCIDQKEQRDIKQIGQFINSNGRKITQILEVNTYLSYYNKFRQNGGAKDDKYQYFLVEYLFRNDTLNSEITRLTELQEKSVEQSEIAKFFFNSASTNSNYVRCRDSSYFANKNQFDSSITESDIRLMGRALTYNLKSKKNHIQVTFDTVSYVTTYTKIDTNGTIVFKKNFSGKKIVQRVEECDSTFLIYSNKNCDSLFAQSIYNNEIQYAISISVIPEKLRFNLMRYPLWSNSCRAIVDKGLSLIIMNYSSFELAIPNIIYQCSVQGCFIYYVDQNAMKEKLSKQY